MAADDELFVLKNLFHLGCYQQAISESISAHPSNPESAIEAKFFMYRAYIEQGQYRLVLDEVRQDAPPALLALLQRDTRFSFSRLTTTAGNSAVPQISPPAPPVAK